MFPDIMAKGIPSIDPSVKLLEKFCCNSQEPLSGACLRKNFSREKDFYIDGKVFLNSKEKDLFRTKSDQRIKAFLPSGQ